jgi:uncharacterized protein (TIGR03437 family)
MSKLILRSKLETRPPAAVFALIPLVCMLLAAGPAWSQNTITTLAGDGFSGYSGDGLQASSAALNHPRGIAIDSAGMIYIADVDNHRIRRVTPAGIISTFAGNGAYGFSGDGNLAFYASFSNVMGLALDPSGNLYIADSSNQRIRKVTANGNVTTIAGTGGSGSFSGDGGPATAATLNTPTSMVFDAAGNLYFADSSNQRIRRIGTDGIITTIAGNGLEGFSGDGGFATSASMDFPLGLARDQAGNLYFADGNNNRIRKISAAGIISTFVGNGSGHFAGDGGMAFSASINIPSDVAIDNAGNMYIADSGNNRVRKVDPSGIITTVAGTGTDGFSGDGGPASQAMLSFPWGVITDAAGAVYIADRVNSRIRKIAGALVTLAPTLDGTAVNGATFVKNVAIAPGAIVTIFGTNLADGVAIASGAPYPTVLGTTRVTFNGIAAPLFYVSAGQINAQAPFEMGVGSASIQVTRGTTVSPLGSVTVANVSPGIFILDQTTAQGAILHANYAIVGGNSPARTGETLQVYATGLGALQVPVRSGDPSPVALTLSLPIVRIGGVFSTVVYSGLAPGFAGLYQVNVTVPPGLTTGNLPMQITINGVTSNVATVAIQP